MLRIHYAPTNGCRQLHLSGQLSGAWVGELRNCWNHARSTNEAFEVLNLTQVTYIDEHGERLLAEMHEAGVRFVAAGVETKYLLEHLTPCNRGAGEDNTQK